MEGSVDSGGHFGGDLDQPDEWQVAHSRYASGAQK